MRRWFLALALTAACSCGGDDEPESPASSATKPVEDPGDAELPRRVEAQVAQGIQARYGQAVASVECPPRVAVAAGAAFACTAQLEGGAGLPIDVRIIDAAGAFEAREKPVVLLDKLAEVIRARYRAHGDSVEVDCGGAIRSSAPGTRFECRAGPHTVGATVTSWQGRVELAYPDAPAVADPAE